MLVADAIETLDRHVALLLKQNGADFFMQLPRFVKTLQNEPRLSAVLEDLLFEASRELQIINTKRSQVVHALVALRDQLVAAFPAVNDDAVPAVERGDPASAAYGASIAAFNALLVRPSDERWPLERTSQNDQDPLRLMWRILQNKLRSIGNHADSSAVTPLRLASGNVERLLDHAVQEYRLATASSPNVAALRLLATAAELNPMPQIMTRPMEMPELLEFAEQAVFGVGHTIREIAPRASSSDRRADHRSASPGG